MRVLAAQLPAIQPQHQALNGSKRVQGRVQGVRPRPLKRRKARPARFLPLANAPAPCLRAPAALHAACLPMHPRQVRSLQGRLATQGCGPLPHLAKQAMQLAAAQADLGQAAVGRDAQHSLLRGAVQRSICTDGIARGAQFATGRREQNQPPPGRIPRHVHNLDKPDRGCPSCRVKSIGSIPQQRLPGIRPLLSVQPSPLDLCLHLPATLPPPSKEQSAAVEAGLRCSHDPPPLAPLTGTPPRPAPPGGCSPPWPPGPSHPPPRCRPPPRRPSAAGCRPPPPWAAAPPPPPSAAARPAG